MLTKKTLLYAFAYSCAIPALMNIPFAQFIAIILAFPFMGGAWICGTYFVQLFDSNLAYPFGAVLGIFTQVVLMLMLVTALVKLKKRLNAH